MARTKRTENLAGLMNELVLAAEADIPRGIAEDSAHATVRGLGLDLASVPTAQSRRRAEAYFRAVLRRRIVCRRAAPRTTARLVVASVVADLESAGRDGREIWSELERGWRDRIPLDVLEEYRLRLCG